MWLWSKGLGRLLLPMDLEKAKIETDGEKLILKGRIVAPRVNWDYVASLYEEDLEGFVHILNDRVVIRYMVRKEGLRLVGDLMSRACRFLFLYVREESKRWIIGRRA